MSDAARMILVNRCISGTDHFFVKFQTDHLDLIVHPVGRQFAQSDRLRIEFRSMRQGKFFTAVQQDRLLRQPLQALEPQRFFGGRIQHDQIQFAPFPGAENAGQMKQPVTRLGGQCLRDRFMPLADAAEDRTGFFRDASGLIRPDVEQKIAAESRIKRDLTFEFADRKIILVAA